ncbi:MAG: metallophosphoesterase [Myxococcales bacterium]|nr:metallophosphoesterase [Myxococcales bacterium]
MWFVYVGVGLALLVATGLYTRRRLSEALRLLGARERTVRIVRWAMLWLLFAYPLLIIGAVVLSVALGRETLLRFDGLVASVLLAMPFIWAVLVVAQSTVWLVVIDLVHLATRRRHARRRAIAVLAAIGVFAIYTPLRILAERGDVRVRTHLVGPGNLDATPFRIAFVADIQQDVFTDGDDARAVYATINAAKPDLVLSGGDWINTGPDHIAGAAEAAGTLASRLGTFSVRGDHEHFAYPDRERSVGEIERALTAHGVTMLANQVRTFEHAGKRIAIAFLNYNYIIRATPAQVEALVGQLAGADYRIAVTHQLDRKLAALLEGKVHLVLAAHTHGGQVNPVVGVVHVPLARLESPYIDGSYTLGATTVIVTAGVGMSVVPVRYAAPGSLELIELRL